MEKKSFVFEGTLYRAAVDSRAPIRPMTLNYRRISGRRSQKKIETLPAGMAT